jgi:hypothetical protein
MTETVKQELRRLRKEHEQTKRAYEEACAVNALSALVPIVGRRADDPELQSDFAALLRVMSNSPGAKRSGKRQA